MHGGEPEFVVEVSDGESANVTATQSGTKKKQLNVNRYDLVRGTLLLRHNSYHGYLTVFRISCFRSRCPSRR